MLETVAPIKAILLVLKKSVDYDEAEVVVDPYALGAVTVVERLLPSLTIDQAPADPQKAQKGK